MRKLLLLAGCCGLGSAIPQAAQGQVLIGMLFGEKLTTDDFHIGLNVGANLAGLDGSKTARQYRDWCWA